MIFEHSEHLELRAGEIEVEARYFGGRRTGKRGRGALGKVPVFGLFKRQGKVDHTPRKGGDVKADYSSKSEAG